MRPHRSGSPLDRLDKLAVVILAALVRLTLLKDCTALGFNYQLMTVAIAHRRRALPLVWSIHRSSRGAVSAQAQNQAAAHRLRRTAAGMMMAADCATSSPTR